MDKSLKINWNVLNDKRNVFDLTGREWWFENRALVMIKYAFSLFDFPKLQSQIPAK